MKLELTFYEVTYGLKITIFREFVIFYFSIYLKRFYIFVLHMNTWSSHRNLSCSSRFFEINIIKFSGLKITNLSYCLIDYRK